MISLPMFHGMSATKSLPADRKKVLEKLQEVVSKDCVAYGFYIGEISLKPVADYGGINGVSMVAKEINLNDIK